MIVSNRAQAVFHYAYRPLTRDRGINANDGGFSVTLYPNNILLITYYNDRGQPRHQTELVARDGVVARMRALISSTSGWFGHVPANMQLKDGRYHPRFISRIGLEGYHMMEIEDAPCISQGVFLDEDARTARKLVVLLEDACDILRDCGLILGLDGFDIKYEDAQLHQKNDGEKPWLGAAGF